MNQVNKKTLNSNLKRECIKFFCDIIKDGKNFRTKSIGKSMYPAIQIDDYLLIKPIGFKEINIGDIIAYKKDKGDGLLTCHRVVTKKKNYLLTKGDANRFSDLTVYPDEIFGKITHIERKDKIIDLEKCSIKIASFLWAKFSFFRDKIITRLL